MLPPQLLQASFMGCNANLESSLGRTTFVNTLCGKDVLEHKDSDDPTEAHNEEGLKIKPVTVGAYNSNQAQQLRTVY